jgi:hypothetical protein
LTMPHTPPTLALSILISLQKVMMHQSCKPILAAVLTLGLLLLPAHPARAATSLGDDRADGVYAQPHMSNSARGTDGVSVSALWAPVQTSGRAPSNAFLTPSGNIGCITFSRYLRCDIAHKSWRARHTGRSRCPLVRGDSLTMRGTGRPLWTCHGDTVLVPLGSEPVLPYGRTWRSGPFTCRSRISGLTCSNRSGHGFFLSRQSYRVF